MTKKELEEKLEETQKQLADMEEKAMRWLCYYYRYYVEEISSSRYSAAEMIENKISGMTSILCGLNIIDDIESKRISMALREWKCEQKHGR